MKDKNITVDDITEDFIKENDGKITWLRDDYLSMIGYSQNPAAKEILKKVISIKSEMKQRGYVFKA